VFIEDEKLSLPNVLLIKSIQKHPHVSRLIKRQDALRSHQDAYRSLAGLKYSDLSWSV
jgi:hypothetical protein